MIKSIFSRLRKFFLALAGIAGGAICGCLALLLLLHLRMILQFELPSILVLLAIFIPIFSLLGVFAPRFFGMFFLSPLSWLFSADDSAGGHPSVGDDTSMPNFLYNACYMIGLILFGVGVFFTFPWLVAFGATGIVVFALGVRKHTSNKGKTT